MALIKVKDVKISIHALREEGDWHRSRPRLIKIISIHALREEGDFMRLTGILWSVKFLSTPSARRATYEYRIFHTKLVFLSTPSARRATFRVSRQSGSKRISIHALREEGDEMPIYSIPGIENFYPRPPRGGRRKTAL